MSRAWTSRTPAGLSVFEPPIPAGRGADDASVTRSLRLTPAGAVLEALARDLHDAAPHPSSPTLPGLDLDARGVVARRDAGAPVGAALVPTWGEMAIEEHRRAALLEHARDVAADLRDES